MLLIAVQSLGTIPKYSKVSAHALTSRYTDMWERTVLPVAAAIVGEVHTERCTLWCWVVRKVAGVGSVGALALEKVPANGDLGRVVLIHARKATTTGS